MYISCCQSKQTKLNLPIQGIYLHILACIVFNGFLSFREKFTPSWSLHRVFLLDVYMYIFSQVNTMTMHIKFLTSLQCIMT
jgi:hypothetical protein